MDRVGAVLAPDAEPCSPIDYSELLSIQVQGPGTPTASIRSAVIPSPTFFLDRETARIDELVDKKQRLIELLKEKRTSRIRQTVTKGLDPTSPTKPSGVSWLGDVPAHWSVVPLKRVARRIQTGSTPPTSETRFYVDGTIPWYGPGSFGSRLDVGEPAKYVHQSARQEASLRMFPPGTTMVVGIGATLGKSALLPHEGSANQQIIGVVPTDAVEPEYVAWQMRLAEAPIRGRAPRTTLPIITQSELALIPFLKPPLEEQAEIADFLDRETARIDELVDKKIRLIELLEEKRTALISHVVTKGLDPNVPMKDSGVLWIGEIPAHWSVLRNKVPIRQMDDRSGDGSGRLLTVSHLTGVRRRDESPQVTMFMAESLVGYKRCRSGDLVINTMWAWMGGAGVAAEDGLVSPSYNVYRLDHDVIDPSFYDWFVRSPAHVSAMRLNSRGVWTSRLRLYPEVFLSMQGLFPPLEEQHRMSAYLSTATGKMDRLQAKLAEQLELLAEYRQALITAAVTGQIDIAAQPSEPEEAIA